jgi:quinohemoprotein amine dehydrogenase
MKLPSRKLVSRPNRSAGVWPNVVAGLIFVPASLVLAQTGERGIPVTDSLTRAKCGICHASDERGNMEHISWVRSTPEGWQDALKRMVAMQELILSPEEARSVVEYLSDRHGLAPEEAREILYDPERRIHEEIGVPAGSLRAACAKCHSFARAVSSRRSLDEWEYLATTHAARYRAPLGEEAFAFLTKTAPLRTPEWDAWNARDRSRKLAGHWLVSAYAPGHGRYYGEMDIASGSGEIEVHTTTTLKSIYDGSTIKRSGVSTIYGGYAWRGRSRGSAGPNSAADDLGAEAREVLWIAPDQSRGQGRWFWGQYHELGFDVTLQRASADTTLLGADRSSLQIGSQRSRVRLIGDNFPARVRPADLNFGAGVVVRRVVSRTAKEVVVEVDVAATVHPGKRNLVFRQSVLPNAIAIYDRVDYVKVTPEPALASFGNQKRTRGYQQFEAIGYQRGADGKSHTEDDVDLGPIDVTWSIEVFYAPEGSNTDHVGKVSATGFFTPAAESPNNNFDVWVIATAKNETDKNGKPLVGKGYLVVTVPEYTFNGRRYVRELDRWIDDGPSPK